MKLPPPVPGKLDQLRHLGAVGCAAALALAAVLSFAAVVARLAAALAFAVVLAFTGMLGGLVGTGETHAGLCRLDGRAVGTIGGSLGRNGGSADQSGECCRQKQCIQFFPCH